jgi:hypothetical protein
MDLEEFQDRMGMWRRSEIILIRVFLVLFTSLTLAQIAYDLWQREVLDTSFWHVMLGLGSDLVVAYALTSFIMGIYFFHHFRGEGMIGLREILKTMVQVALVVAIFFTILLALDVGSLAETGLYEEGGPLMTFERSGVMLVAFFALTLGGTLLAMMVILVGGFGIMGMLYILEVGGVPKLINALEGITRKEDTGSKALMWFMLIPGALDTDMMLVEEPSQETVFPWRRFRTAVLWQVAFGVIIAIYVSLNPWLLRAFSVNELFRFMSTAFVVIPLIVIPWFIFKRLDARIKGVSRDFKLYASFKDRMTRIIIAGSTLLIFLRLAYESNDVMDIMLALTGYIFVMVLCIIAFTFIYFNFFENRLARECFLRWQVGRRSTPDDATADGGEDGEVTPPLSE